MQRWIWAALVVAGCSERASDHDRARPPDAGTLRVTGLTPAEGAPGDQVGFTGVGFDATPRNVQVFFGGRRAELVSVSKDAIVVVAPEGDSGTRVDVLVVFEPGGEFSMNDGFRYR